MYIEDAVSACRTVYLICMDRETANVDKTDKQTDRQSSDTPPPILKHSSAQRSSIRSNSVSSSNKGTGNSYEVLHPSHTLPTSVYIPSHPFPVLSFPFLSSPKPEKPPKSQRKKERKNNSNSPLTHSQATFSHSQHTNTINIHQPKKRILRQKEVSFRYGIASLPSLLFS